MAYIGTTAAKTAKTTIEAHGQTVTWRRLIESGGTKSYLSASVKCWLQPLGDEMVVAMQKEGKVNIANGLPQHAFFAGDVHLQTGDAGPQENDEIIDGTVIYRMVNPTFVRIGDIVVQREAVAVRTGKTA